MIVPGNSVSRSRALTRDGVAHRNRGGALTEQGSLLLNDGSAQSASSPHKPRGTHMGRTTDKHGKLTNELKEYVVQRLAGI